MEVKRVFIAMPAGLVLTEFAAGFRRAHAELNVRWIRPENLHVTMVPPWEVQEPDPVCRALEGIAAAHAPVSVHFDTVSFGPDARRPKLVWATGTAPAALTELSAGLRSSFGSGAEARRKFLFHLTLARLHRQSISSSGDLMLRGAVVWHGLLDTLCLYESILKPSGAEYRVLCRCPLSGS
jgi:RNA 2',3'-cyclic 3'-phosphodiesterase